MSADQPKITVDLSKLPPDFWHKAYIALATGLGQASTLLEEHSKNLVGEYFTLETERNQLREQCAALTAELNEHRKTSDQLKVTIGMTPEIQGAIDNIHSRVAGVIIENGLLVAKNADLEARVAALTAERNQLHSDYVAMGENLDACCDERDLFEKLCFTQIDMLREMGLERAGLTEDVSRLYIEFKQREIELLERVEAAEAKLAEMYP